MPSGIGLAQIMMQCGMFVPAKAFTANVCERTLTHLKREEDTAMESGKFDEELRRMDAIADHLMPNAMVLFNESFAATNEREGSEIARQIVSALTDQGVKAFFVSHQYRVRTLLRRAAVTRHIVPARRAAAERHPDLPAERGSTAADHFSARTCISEFSPTPLRTDYRGRATCVTSRTAPRAALVVSAA